MRHGKVTPAVASKTIQELLNNESLRANAERLAPALQAARGEVDAAEIIAGLACARCALEKVG